MRALSGGAVSGAKNSKASLGRSRSLAPTGGHDRLAHPLRVAGACRAPEPESLPFECWWQGGTALLREAVGDALGARAEHRQQQHDRDERPHTT